MKYGHKEARRDIRFIFSDEGMRPTERGSEVFKRVYNFHLLDKRRNKNKGKKRPCERCFKYFFRIQSRFSKKEEEK